MLLWLSWHVWQQRTLKANRFNVNVLLYVKVLLVLLKFESPQTPCVARVICRHNSPIIGRIFVFGVNWVLYRYRWNLFTANIKLSPSSSSYKHVFSSDKLRDKSDALSQWSSHETTHASTVGIFGLKVIGTLPSVWWTCLLVSSLTPVHTVLWRRKKHVQRCQVFWKVQHKSSIVVHYTVPRSQRLHIGGPLRITDGCNLIHLDM